MKKLIKRIFGALVPLRYRRSMYDAGGRCRRAALSLYLLGFRIQCPLCNWRFRRLLPGGVASPAYDELKVIGGGYRRNAWCPHCFCSDRERLVYIYLSQETRVFEASLKLLHVAPEKNLQRVLRRLDNIEYVSADLESPLAAVKMDITCIEMEAGVFDVIICNHVLEHVPDDRKAMSELLRVLKPGGWAILQVPVSPLLNCTVEDPAISDPQERLRRFGQSDHVRVYGRDYRSRLESAGFVVEEWGAGEELGPQVARKYALAEQEKLYICRKPAQSNEVPAADAWPACR